MKSKIDVKRMLVKNSMEALSYLDELISEEKSVQLQNLIFITKGDLVDLAASKTAGTISHEEHSRDMSRIRLNILNIIEEVPDRLFSTEAADENVTRTVQENHSVFIETLSLIRQLADLRVEEFKYFNDQNRDAIYSHMNTSRHILVNQIVKLVEMNNFTLSSAEYRVIADAFQGVFDNVKAEEYYKRAIETIDEYTDSANSKVVAARSYATYLYSVNKVEEGAQQFKAAILNNPNDLGNTLNGYTYQLKFAAEADLGLIDHAIISYKKAKEYYNLIINPYYKTMQLQTLEKTWAAKPNMANYTRP